jgi:hypothetical protein
MIPLREQVLSLPPLTRLGDPRLRDVYLKPELRR